MVHSEPPNRSRIAWPVRHPPGRQVTPGVPAHRHRTTRALWSHSVAQDLVLVMLTYLVIINFQFVLGRGEYRDAEAARMEQQQTERLRQFACDLLDGLPAGPLLDPKREQYGCGPGVPAEELQPEALAQLRQFSEPGREDREEQAGQSYDRKAPREDPAEATAAPTTRTPAPIATQAPATPAATPTAGPAPPQDVSPLTDTVCDLLGVCL